MIQIVDYDWKMNRHIIGKGQQIETVMANQVGTKIFKIYQPVKLVRRQILRAKVWTHSWQLRSNKFEDEQLAKLVQQLKKWDGGNCLDSSAMSVIQFWKSFKDGKSWITSVDDVVVENGTDLNSVSDHYKEDLMSMIRDWCKGNGEDFSACEIMF